MYKLLKDKGNNMNITVTNTEKKTSVIIGKMSMKLLSILEEKEAIIFTGEENTLTLTDKWDINIEEATAKALLSLTINTEKPVRDQSKKQKIEDEDEIDALDVLLGRASYSI